MTPEIEATSDMKKAFEGIDVAILLELERNVIGFKTNSVLFRAYGLLINTQAKKDVKVNRKELITALLYDYMND